MDIKQIRRMTRRHESKCPPLLPIPRFWIFFTQWSLTLLLLATLIPSLATIFNIPFLATIVLLLGSYFSFVDPRYYRIPLLSHHQSPWILTGWPRFLLADILFHLLPWIYAISTFPLNVNPIPSLFLLFVYCQLFTPSHIYLTRHSLPFDLLSIRIGRGGHRPRFD